AGGRRSGGVGGMWDGELMVAGLLEFHQPHAVWFGLVGGLAVACQAAGTGGFLLGVGRRHPLRQADARLVFAFVGLTAFAAAVVFGFLVYWNGDTGRSLEHLAVPVAAAGVPVLAAGLLLPRRLAPARAPAGRR